MHVLNGLFEMVAVILDGDGDNLLGPRIKRVELMLVDLGNLLY